MRLYLAARYSRREEMEHWSFFLCAKGYEITSRWITDKGEEWCGDSNEIWTGRALVDLEDVDRADAVVSFTHPRGTPVTGGGRHVEFGYGYARGKRMIIIGEREHVFHHLPNIEIYPDVDAWLQAEASFKRKKAKGK